MKNNKKNENYLERIPIQNSKHKWSTDENGNVTIYVENKGWLNRLFQKFFKKPAVSQIHLDETGSFVWPLIDGKKSILDIGKDVEKHFGEKANPLYERLAQFFHILESYKFIMWETKE